MTEQTIPADQVREIVEKMHYHANHDNVRGGEEEYVRFFARQLAELLPAPGLPTLADMPPRERDAFKWMQCDIKNHSARYVIATPCDKDNIVGVVSPDGGIDWFYPKQVTPRPDLPRMAWPGDQQEADQ